MQVKLTNDFVFVKTPFAHKDFVSDTLNGVWSKKMGMYRFPRNIHAMRELMRYYPELMQNTVFVEAGKKMAATRDRFIKLRREESPDAIKNDKLRPYQKMDVFYLKHLPHAGIFNEPRTGKTPTSIELIKQLGAKRNLVIAPASLIWNWAAEFEKWYPRAHTFVVHGDVEERNETKLMFLLTEGPCTLIVSKDMLKPIYRKNKDTKQTEQINKDINWIFDYEFDAVFVDEAHYLRNYKTAQSMAIFKVKAKHRYALTGTPAVKHGKDIYGILHFLYPERFPSYWQFVERYWGTYQNGYGTDINDNVKLDRKTELEELIGFISVQRKRSEVMQWLPKKMPIEIPVKMGDKQRKLYDQMVDTFVASDPDEDIMIDTPNVLSQIMRMRQLCIDPRLLGFKAPSAKTEALLEWLDDNREPVVIMSMFTSYLKLIKPEIEALGLKVGEINGEMVDSAEKHRVAQSFQKGEIDVLLCNIISAGVGFTLDRAETIIFTDKAWNPTENEQAEDRITPTTEDRNHKHAIITFTCTDSFDYEIERLLETKQSLTDVVRNGGREAIMALLRK